MISSELEHLKPEHIAALDSYCDVCFVSFQKIAPRKIDQGIECLYCVKCHCHVHKCCYDLQANSTYISSKIREFVCERCTKKETVNKACIICHKKEGALKVIEGGNTVIHVFCGLIRQDINVLSYYPQIVLKKAVNYKEVSDKCGLCQKNNATEQCAMQSCTKKFHGYCVWLNLKTKQLEQDEPQCEKYYFSSGDNGCFDLTKQILPQSWVFQQFDKILSTFEQYGFIMKGKNKIKSEVYKEYIKNQQGEDKDQKTLKRGGFAYVLCKDHQSSIYCNCLNRGSGDMVQCECCFQWYHQKCVGYSQKKENQQYICQYCHSFYDLKKKMIDQVKNSKSQHYEIKFDSPKLHLADFIWLMRAIDCRIAGGAASKMMKQLIKYPLKTSKMDLIIRSQNRKKLASLNEEFIEKYLQSEEHEELIRPRTVLILDKDQKPINVNENIEYNKKLKEYVEFIQSFVKKNNLPDSFGPVIAELRFKERAVQNNYENISELVKTKQEYAEMGALKVMMDAYSFMEILKDINSGSMINFEELEEAVRKAKLSTSVPNYLLKPLIQRYEKVKNLVQLVSNNIHLNKETSPDIESAVQKLAEDKVFPPRIYQSFHSQRKFIKNLYLLYLKQQGKSLEEGLDTTDKIKILLNSPVCKSSPELVYLLNQFDEGKYQSPVYSDIQEIVNKYMKVIVAFQIKDYLKKKNIKIKILDSLVNKSEFLKISEDDLQISGLVNDWKKIKSSWSQIKTEFNESIAELDDIIKIGDVSRGINDVLKAIESLPVIITDKQQEVKGLGSINQLQNMRECLTSLLALVTESQLKKNPLTQQKLPQKIPKDNPLVKQYYSLKKEQAQLMNKYKAYYDRIKQKIHVLKSDSKKQRKDQLKDNLQKPKLSDISDFIDVLKNSKVSMENQIKELTKTVNHSLDIASKARKFLSEENHIEDIFNQEKLNKIKKELQELRKKVLNEAQLCLDSELKELYHVQICLRMQMMIVSSHVELEKMNKLLKFAEEEGLNHMSIFRRLQSKFEVGHQTNKQMNLFKKNQAILKAEGQKQYSHKEPYYLYRNLANTRKTLTLGMARPMKQKSQHIDALLNRNTYLKNKIQMIIMQEPKKYDIEQIRAVYCQALKHPFEIEGLSKLMQEAEKVEKFYKQWKLNKGYQSSYSSLFDQYESLAIGIEEIQNNMKAIKECQNAIKRIKELSENSCSIEALQKVEQVMDSIETSHIEKNSEIYFIAKAQYLNYWINLLKKLEKQKVETIPYCKVKSLSAESYHLLQKSLRNHVKNQSFRIIIGFFQNTLNRIKKFCLQGKIIETIFEGFIDIEDLKYQLDDGLNINDEIIILNPYNDINKFYHLDLLKVLNKQQEESTLKRQRSETLIQNQEAYKPRKLTKEAKSQIESQSDKQWDKNISNKVTQAQRTKIKEILLKNIKKNTLLAANIDNVEEQVRLIENQLFGEFHNNIVKYLQISNSFEKLFIKLVNFPNISARVAKKKLQWSFLKLLMESKDKFADVEKALVTQQSKQQENVSQAQKQKQLEKQRQLEKKKQSVPEKKKERNIEEMIASGNLDESVKRQFKKQIKAIRQSRHKKKKHKSSRRRSRSRSRSRSPQARFSSQSEQDQEVPNKSSYVEKQYNNDPSLNKPYFSDYFNKSSEAHALMFDPEDADNQKIEEKTSYPVGTLLQIKKADLEFTVRKGKAALKGVKIMSNQDYKKIVVQLVDPNFTNIQIRKDKPDQQIIAYLSKPSRKKYKFLFGWFEGNKDDENEMLRDFSIEINDKKKIYGVQNENVKMHIMSIRQYLRINRLHDPPEAVSSQSAATYLREDRLIFLLQYPSEKMYQLKGNYENFKNIQAFENTYPVILPEVPTFIPERIHQPLPYMNHFNPLMPSPLKMPEISIMQQPEIQGWQNNDVQNSFIPPMYPNMNSNVGYSNILSRFSPIMTDEEDNPNENQIGNKNDKDAEFDEARNILNSLADINIKDSDLPHMSSMGSKSFEEQDKTFDHYRHPQENMSHSASVMHMNPMAGNPMGSNPMAGNRWPNQPYGQQPQYPRPYSNPMMSTNPMSANRYGGNPVNPRMMPPPGNPMAYKNPMAPYPPGGIPPPPPYGQHNQNYDYSHQKRQ